MAVAGHSSTFLLRRRPRCLRGADPGLAAEETNRKALGSNPDRRLPLVASRSRLLPLGLVVVALLWTCSRDRDLPPLQTVALEVAGGDLQPFEGRWFDGLDGYPMAVVRGGERPSFSVLLSEELRLESARLEEGDLLFRFRGREGVRTLCLHPIGEDALVLIPLGGSPSWCGTCTPYLERNRPILKVVGRQSTEIVEILQVAYDNTWNWLVDVL